MDRTLEVGGGGGRPTRDNNAALRRRDGMFLNHISQGIFALGGLLVLIVLGRALWQNPSVFIQQVLNGLQLGFIYALIAL